MLPAFLATPFPGDFQQGLTEIYHIYLIKISEGEILVPGRQQLCSTELTFARRSIQSRLQRPPRCVASETRYQFAAKL